MAHREEPSSIVPECTENTAREETSEQDKVQRSLEEGIKVQKSLEESTEVHKLEGAVLAIQLDLMPQCSKTLIDTFEPVAETKEEPFRFRNFRDEVLGQPCPKRFRADLAELINETETLHISCNRGQKKRTIDAAVSYDASGPQCMTISCSGWAPQERFIQQPVTAAVFSEQMKKERMASVCSYHEIKTKKDYFHCIWQIENPAKSEFFRKSSRRSRLQANGTVADVNIPGPTFEGAENTTWQAIAYPYGYRSNNREGLVGMAVRYNSGPEAQICAGFQITLLEPSQLCYRGIQETVREHCDKLQETSKKSNVFKRGKKGWVLRKFANRDQLRLCKKSSIVFVLSFCIYGREQTQFRHRFPKDIEEVETSIAAHMRRLWNNGNPAGRVRLEAKNGKIFRAHSQVLQLNGGALAHIADRLSPDQKQPIKFPDMTEAVLKKLLEYCYTLQVTGLNRTPFELLLAAHRYDLRGLQHLAEREIARNIDLDNIIDLHVWNEALQSPFLAEFVALFLTVNYAQLRLQPEFADKLSPAQQLALDQKYRRPELEPDMSEGREGFISDDDDDDGNDSGLESQDDAGIDAPPDHDDDSNSQDFTVRIRHPTIRHYHNSVIRMAPVALNNHAPVFQMGVQNNPEEPEEGQAGDLVVHHGANMNDGDMEDVAAFAHLLQGIPDIDQEALELMWMFM